MNEKRIRWMDYLQPYEEIPGTHALVTEEFFNITLEEARERNERDTSFKERCNDALDYYDELMVDWHEPTVAYNALRIYTLLKLLDDEGDGEVEFDIYAWELMLILLRNNHAAGVYFIAIYMALGNIPNPEYGCFSIESDAFSFFEKLLLDGNPYAIRHWVAIGTAFESQPAWRRFNVPRDWFEKYYGYMIP